MITLENWRERMSEDMRLRDLRPRTIESYLLAVRLFVEWRKKDPEKLTEQDVRQYVLHLRDDKHQAPSRILKRNSLSIGQSRGRV
jgi:integrase/recombinase XerD